MLITAPKISPNLLPLSTSRCLPNTHPVTAKTTKYIGPYAFHGRNRSINVILITATRKPINPPGLCFLPRSAPIIGRAIKRIMNIGEKARNNYIFAPRKKNASNSLQPVPTETHGAAMRRDKSSYLPISQPVGTLTSEAVSNW